MTELAKGQKLEVISEMVDRPITKIDQSPPIFALRKFQTPHWKSKTTEITIKSISKKYIAFS